MYGRQRVRGCGFRGRVWFICVRRSAEEVAIEMLNIELNIGINVEIKVE